MYKTYSIPTIDIAIILDRLETVTHDLERKGLAKEAQEIYSIAEQLNNVAQNSK